jgi:transposase
VPYPHFRRRIMLSCLLPDPDLIEFDEVALDESNGQIVCTAATTQMPAACPACGQPAVRIHSGYQRQLADLPWAGIPVQIWLQVRRFFCKNTACQRKIFCERMPTVAAPWARRTQRMTHAQQTIGLTVGGAGGTRLCAALAMDAGIDLLLALIRNLQLPEAPTPQVLGVDDWAKRKGQTYGTILVDLERGEVVDLLSDRTAEGLEQWLKAHPGVEIISRDRAGAYAEGARQGAPDAVQVADRWHLLKNLTDAVYKALQQHQTEIERALVQGQSKEQGILPTIEGQLLAATDTPQPTEADLARQKRAEEAQRLYSLGWTTQTIAARLGMCPRTIRRYLKAELPLPPARRSQRTSLLDAYKSYILQRWNAGCHTAAQLYREIRSQGFAGQISIVRDFVAQLRRASGLPPGVRNAPSEQVAGDPSVRPPTVRALSFLVMRPPDQVDAREKEHVARLVLIHPKIQTTVELARQFAAMVRHRQAHQLDDWLEKAATSQVSALRSFASGLRQDESAIRAALSLPYSNGPTEGHINRLKCLKRAMYGRAKLDLLRQRLLAA